MNLPAITDDDQMHVILDALSELEDQIDRGETEPWNDYETEPDEDAKRTALGYLATLSKARRSIEDKLSRCEARL